MSLLPSLFKDETVLELLKDTQHEMGIFLSKFMNYRNRFEEKLGIVNKFMRTLDAKRFQEMKQKFEEINFILVTDLKLNEVEEDIEETSEKKVKKSIKKEENPIIKKKLEEFEDELKGIHKLLIYLQQILKAQLILLKSMSEKGFVTDELKKEINEFVVLVDKEFYCMHLHGHYTDKELGLNQELLLHLMDIVHMEEASEKSYKLPVERGKITGFGHTPHHDWRYHHLEQSKYGWDFTGEEGTPVFASRGGEVVYVFDSSKLNGGEILKPIYGWFIAKDKGDYAGEFLKCFEERRDLQDAHPEIKALVDAGEIEKAMEKLYALFGQNNNTIIIKHGEDIYSEYVHLRYNSARVKVGDIVKKGQLIAELGNTGFSAAPHLHFDVFKQVGEKRTSIQVKFEKT